MRGRGLLVLAILLLAAGFLILATAMFGSDVTTQVSQGQPFSSVYLPSLPQSTASRLVYVQDAATDNAHELWSAPIDGGAPVRLSNALTAGQSVKFVVTPDGSRVAYVTDQTTRGIPDLYSVPITGGASIKLSMDLSQIPGQVIDNFLASPTSQRVYYVADGATNNVLELWRVDLAGGPSTRLNKPISGTYDVREFMVSPQDRIVFRVGSTVLGKFQLWSVPGDGRGAQAVIISTPLVAIGSSTGEFFLLTPDGQRVIYSSDALDDARYDLWSVSILGGSSTRLDKDDGRSVKRTFTVDDSSVVYSYGPTEFYRVPVTGGASIPVPAPMPEPVRSPDGAWIVYGAGVGLWSSGDDGGHQLVSCAGQAVTATFLAKPAYSVSPDSKRVVYIAGGEVWTSPISGSVCLIFKDGFESGNLEGWR